MLKKIKEETLLKISEMEVEINNQKESYNRNQGLNDNQIKTLKDRANDLTLQLARKD